MHDRFFSIIGAQRSGTTYLFHVLDEHPDIQMARPLRPEPKYFLDENQFDRGKEYYLKTFFTGIRKSVVLGEKSTSYINSPMAGQRIKKFFPEAKILVILRNPVYRAISNYFFSRNNGLEPRSLEDTFLFRQKEPDWDKEVSVNPFDYLGRGEYLQYLEPYARIFGRDRLKIVINEQIIGNIDAIQSLYQFLEVDTRFTPSTVTKVINASNPDSHVPSEVIASIHDHFSSHIDTLENWLKEDLSIWRE